MRTGFASLKLGKALYIVPFLMAYTPINMTPGSEWFDIIIVWGSGFMGFFCTSASLEGYMRRKLEIWERIVFALAGGLLFFYVPWMKITGALIMAAMIAIQYMSAKDEGAASPSPVASS